MGANKNMRAISKETKAFVRAKFYQAVKSGKIERMPCVICGSPNADGHHRNYTKPFEVVWLCKSDHSRLRYHHDEPRRRERKITATDILNSL